MKEEREGKIVPHNELTSSNSEERNGIEEERINQLDEGQWD